MGAQIYVFNFAKSSTNTEELQEEFKTAGSGSQTEFSYNGPESTRISKSTHWGLKRTLTPTVARHVPLTNDDAKTDDIDVLSWFW